MGDEKVIVLESIWFSSLTEMTTIGIVKIDTGYGLKWYIGVAEGLDKEYDEQYIAKWGTPIYPETMQEFFNSVK